MIQSTLFQGRLTEALAGENSEQLFTAEATIKSLKAGNASLLDHLENLKKSSRTANPCMLNIPEDSEDGQDPTTFVCICDTPEYLTKCTAHWVQSQWKDDSQCSHHVSSALCAPDSSHICCSENTNKNYMETNFSEVLTT